MRMFDYEVFERAQVRRPKPPTLPTLPSLPSLPTLTLSQNTSSVVVKNEEMLLKPPEKSPRIEPNPLQSTVDELLRKLTLYEIRIRELEEKPRNEPNPLQSTVDDLLRKLALYEIRFRELEEKPRNEPNPLQSKVDELLRKLTLYEIRIRELEEKPLNEPNPLQSTVDELLRKLTLYEIRIRELEQKPRNEPNPLQSTVDELLRKLSSYEITIRELEVLRDKPNPLQSSMDELLRKLKAYEIRIRELELLRDQPNPLQSSLDELLRKLSSYEIRTRELELEVEVRSRKPTCATRAVQHSSNVVLEKNIDFGALCNVRMQTPRVQMRDEYVEADRPILEHHSEERTTVTTLESIEVERGETTRVVEPARAIVTPRRTTFETRETQVEEGDIVHVVNEEDVTGTRYTEEERKTRAQYSIERSKYLFEARLTEESRSEVCDNLSVLCARAGEGLGLNHMTHAQLAVAIRGILHRDLTCEGVQAVVAVEHKEALTDPNDYLPKRVFADVREHHCVCVLNFSALNI